jgi:Cu(I)/Ag(I) efflux system membrane fusion protein
MMSEEKTPEKNISDKRPEGDKTGEKLNIPAYFRHELDGVYNAYFDIQTALAGDSLKDAKKASQGLETAISRISHGKLKPEVMKEWHKLKIELQTSAGNISTKKNIKDAREAFSSLSSDVYELCRKFGTSGNFSVYRFFCPMAFNNKGGYWLQNKVELFNPYFGKTMLKCGEKIEDVVK